MSLFRKRTSDAAVSRLNLKTVCPAVPHWVPGGLGSFPMGRVCGARSLLHVWTTGLQLCNGLSEIGDDFCLLLVWRNHFVNSIVLLDGCIHQVVQLCSHFFCLDNFLCSCLIGKGQVAGGHAVDVAHIRKCGHPMILPVNPCMVKEGMMFPLLPWEHHFPTVESMFGASHHHHFLGDGHTCVLCKKLALLLLVRVDGKWKVRIDFLLVTLSSRSG